MRNVKGLSLRGLERGDAPSVFDFFVIFVVLDGTDPLESSGTADPRLMLDRSSSRLRLSAIVVAWHFQKENIVTEGEQLEIIKQSFFLCNRHRQDNPPGSNSYIFTRYLLKYLRRYLWIVPTAPKTQPALKNIACLATSYRQTSRQCYRWRR